MNNYFQSYFDYFWQWEEGGEIIAIPGGNTIAYERLISEVLQHIAPQGVPPLGSLLLAIVATNPRANESLDFIAEKLKNQFEENKINSHDCFSFLKLLESVPPVYKIGKNRLLLFQAIFQQCHNIQSITVSNAVARGILHLPNEVKTQLKEFDKKIFKKDFRPIEVLNKKFSTVEDLMKAMSGLPDLTHPIQLEESENNNDVGHIVDQLIANDKTFFTGSLIRHIWGGLNIPVHSQLPSDQPIGGFSDVTNKGDFDRLLISEFAHEDLVFLSRIANNEALYIQREIPPQNNDLQRVILIDIALRNWGTPKTIAFAVMLAIALHPKSDFSCTAFAIGKECKPIHFSSVEGVISGLQLLDPGLHPGDGLQQFFLEFPKNKNREVILITHKESLLQAEMLRAIHTHFDDIQYLIHTDETGGIDVFKQQKNKRHLQHLSLPLNDLWKRKNTEKDQPVTQKPELYCSDYPILVNSYNQNAIYCYTPEGDVFCVTRDRSILRSYSASSQAREKGWELVFNGLKNPLGESLIQRTEDGFLFMKFFPGSREIELVNLSTGQLRVIPFPYWKPKHAGSFRAGDNRFYYVSANVTYIIHPNGEVRTQPEVNAHLQPDNQLGNGRKKIASYSGTTIRHIKQVGITEYGQLKINKHLLFTNKYNEFEFGVFENTGDVLPAEQITPFCFQFRDGSTVELIPSGIIVLKSSNPALETIFIPAMLGKPIAAATATYFSGNNYYRKEQMFGLNIQRPADDLERFISIIAIHSDLDRTDLKRLIEYGNYDLLPHFSRSSRLFSFEKELEAIGAKAEIVEMTQSSSFPELTLSPPEFFQKVLQPFIQHIQQHGTAN